MNSENHVERKPSLEAVELSKKFGGQEILAGVSFGIAAGEVLVILGAAGNGKTTMLRITHDQEEALELADRIIVLNQGRIEQMGALTPCAGAGARGEFHSAECGSRGDRRHVLHRP